MSGPERGRLNQALLAAYPRRADLDQFLLFELDRTLDHHASEAVDMRETVHRVVEAAVAGNWLPELLNAALVRSRNHALHTWARPYMRTG